MNRTIISKRWGLVLPVMALLSLPSAAMDLNEESKGYKGIHTFKTQGLNANLTIKTLPEDTDAVCLIFRAKENLKSLMKDLSFTEQEGCLEIIDRSEPKESTTRKVRDNITVVQSNNRAEASTAFLEGDLIVGKSKVKPKKGRSKVTIVQSNSRANVIIGNVQGDVIYMGRRINKTKDSEISSELANPILDLEVILSHKTALQLGVSGGRCEIGNTNSKFSALIESACKMKVSEIGADVMITLSGSGSFRALKISGDNLEFNNNGSGDMKVDTIHLKSAKFNVSGSGDIKVKDGNVSQLTASVSGSGDVKIKCIVNDADLSALGSGNINVKEVNGDLVRNAKGGSKIKVGNHPKPKSKKKGK